MSNETVFYILGLGLTAIAVIVSFVGLRFKNFPGSRAVVIGGSVAVAVLVVATSVFAWRNGEDEQAHKAEELAHAAEENEEAGDTTEADEEEGSEAAATTTSTVTASAEEGAQLFDSQGCGGCHTLAAAGSTGTTGPDLDGELDGETPEFIKTAIIDPNDEIAQSYPPDVMPQNYEDQMSPEQIDSLVQFLVEATGGSSN
jgi:mono/diheme cytochrome c family protein